MGYNHKVCEDDDDAARMAETILRNLGYNKVARGPNEMMVSEEFSAETLKNIARNAERIARWARNAERIARWQELQKRKV